MTQWTSSSAVAERPRDVSCLSVVSFNSTKRRVESFIVSHVSYRFVTACSLMRCSVVFGVTLMLFVINISSSSPAIKTAAYYQRCVTTCCGTVAVVHRRPWQHLACCSLNTRQRSKNGSESRFLPTQPVFDASVGGGPVGVLLCRLARNDRMVWLPDSEKNLMICLFVLTWSTNVAVTQTDTQTPHDDIGRACVASRGKNCRKTYRKKMTSSRSTCFMRILCNIFLH